MHSFLERPGGGLDQAPGKKRGVCKSGKVDPGESRGVISHHPDRGKMRTISMVE